MPHPIEIVSAFGPFLPWRDDHRPPSLASLTRTGHAAIRYSIMARRTKAATVLA